jgi:PAS domain S-box-containing protein
MASRSKSERKVPKTGGKSDAMLLEVMDETLEQIFKGVGVEVIHASFEKNFQLKREEIVKNPDRFSAGLERLLGSAAVVIEKLIIKNLHRKIGFDYVETEDFQFSDSVNELRWKISLIEEKANEDSRKEESKAEKVSRDSSVSSAVATGDRDQPEKIKDYACFCDSIIESMQIGLDVWRLESAGNTATLRLVFSNPAAEHITGLARKAVLGKTLVEVFPKLLESEFPRVCFEVIHSGKARDLGEIHYGDERIPGSIFSVKVFPLPDNCVGVTFEKSTAHRQKEEALEEEEERYRNLVETAPEAIYTISAENGTITSLNPAFEKITGWQRSEWLGKSFMSIIHPDDLPLAIETFQKTLCGEVIPPYELRVRSKSGKYLTGEFTSKPQIERGKIIGELGIVRDITERKKTEERMEKLNRSFLSFKADPDGNIDSIVALCGELLGATYALYNRLDQGMLCSVGRWNTPPDYNPVDKPSGHICYDVIQQGADDITVISNLHDTVYAKTDPNVARYKLQTCVGKAVRFDDSYIGSLCLLYKGDFDPHEEDKKIIGLLASAIGVEEKRRQALLQMRDSEEKFRVISASAMDAIILVDVKGRISYWNPAAQRIFGYTNEEVSGKNVFNLIVPKHFHKDIHKALERLQKTGHYPLMGKEIEFAAKSKDGKEFPAELSLSALQIKGQWNAVGIVRDITERKRMEHALKEDEEKYRGISKKLETLMKSSAVMLRTMDMRKRLKTVAEAVREQGWKRVVISLRDENLNTTDVVTAGLTPKEEQYLKGHQAPGHVWGKRLSSMFERYRLGEFYYLPWSDPLVQEQFKYALTSKVPKEDTVDWNPDDLLYIPLRLPSGQVVGIMSMDDPADGRRPTKESLAPLELFAHQAAVAVESARLIQQLNVAKNQLEEYTNHLEEKVKERTKNLKESEEKLRSIFAASPDAITATDLEAKIIECNEQSVKMHGYSSKKELIGKSALALISTKDRQKAIENMKKAFEQGSIKNVEYAFVTKDGREFPAELSATVIKDASGKAIGFVAMTKDITARKQMEQQLFKSERLAAIGELAAMIGHDLRNPLTGITGAAYYLKTKFGKRMDVKAKEMLEIIEKDIEYSNKIINDLLEYSRELKLELIGTTPKSIMRETLPLVTVPENIRVVNLTKNKPRMKADVEKMKRTFANMIKNAFDAMPIGGTLTIRSRKVNANVQIVFSDTGVGMSKQVLDKLWRPLFTTKAKGMGFGLPICKRIVEAHGGKISVETTVGKGTTFTIIVPIEPKVEGGEEVWVNVPESLSSTMTKA